MPAEQPKESNAQSGDVAEPLRRKYTYIHTTAEYGVKVRRLRGKDGLFKVTDPEKKADYCVVDLNAKTCTCPDFTQQGVKCPHIEIVENIGKIRSQKKKEYDREYNREYNPRYYQENKERINERKKKRHREYRRERYHSDPEFRAKALESLHKTYSKYREAYERLVTKLGGKCSVCGEDDLDVLQPHHPDGKEEKGRRFIDTKEFRDWVNHGIKPNVVILCANHHLKLHAKGRRGEADSL